MSRQSPTSRIPSSASIRRAAPSSGPQIVPMPPTTIKDIYAALPSIKADGTTVILVEQDINQALSVCDRFYCFQEGRVSLTGRPGDADKAQIKAAYFGI